MSDNVINKINIGGSTYDIIGVPDGGTAGQVLTKNSETDYDVSWEDAEGGGITPITYSDLKTLRDQSELVPGMQYRITDYECTTSQIYTQSAGNVFDIIVTADDTSTLNENARACHHVGDTYFQNCKLDAWELKYCLDNDADRFYWAYRLCVGFDYMDEETQKTYTFETPIGPHDSIPAFDITDWTNTGNTFVDSLGSTMNESCKYRFNGTSVLKTMTCDNGDWTYRVTGSSSTYRSITIMFNDGSGNSAKSVYSSSTGTETFGGISGWLSLGNFRGYTLYLYKPNTGNITSARIIRLYTTSLNTTMRYDESDGKGVIYYMKDEWNNECPYDFKNIQFKRWAVTEYERYPKLTIDIVDYEYDYGLYYGAKDFEGTKILQDATYDENTYNGYFYTFASFDDGDDEWFDFTLDGINCHNNRMSKASIAINTTDCAVLNNNVFFNDFNSFCINNNLLNGLDNTFVGGYNNLFEADCRNNILINCSANTFGGTCNNNILDSDCSDNIFGHHCQYNIIEEECGGNIFGNGFSGNTLGNECFANTFGNRCTDNIFDTITSSTVFDNVHFCHITRETEQDPITNVQILNGTGGQNDSDVMTITFDNTENYTQIAGVNSSGVLKIWNPADLIY